MFYFVVAVLAITAVVQTILIYENKNIEDFYREERRHALKYQAELEARLAHAEKEVKLLQPEQRLAMKYQAELAARLVHAERGVELLWLPTQEVDRQIDEAIQLAKQEVDRQIDEAISLANQERNINE